MWQVFARGLIRADAVQDEDDCGFYGSGALADCLELQVDSSTTVRLTQRGALVCCYTIERVDVLSPPDPSRPCRVALNSAVVLTITACDSLHDLVFLLQTFSTLPKASHRPSDVTFFGRITCKEAAERLRRAATTLPAMVYGINDDRRLSQSSLIPNCIRRSSCKAVICS
jgi:hypothetical protein